jgi:hypothetical protein
MVPGATDFNTQIRDNLNALKSPAFAITGFYTTSSARPTTTGTTFAAITAPLALTIYAYGGNLHMGLQGYSDFDGFLLGFSVNGTVYTGNSPSGLQKVISNAGFHVQYYATGFTASGNYTAAPVWRVAAATDTGRINTSSLQVTFWVREA